MQTTFYKKYLIIIVIVALVALTDAIVFKNAFAQSLWKFAAKPDAFIRSVSVRSSQIVGALIQRIRTSDEKDRLLKENEQLRARIAEMDQYQRDNERLRKQLGVPPRPAVRDEAAILSVQRSASVSTILINKGSVDGIRRSDAVISPGNVLIGVVREVFSESSRVYLTDDPRVSVSVRIGAAVALAEARGNLRDTIVLNLVSAQESIHEQDSLVTSGIDGFPEGLIVGTISQISVRPGDLFKTVFAGALFNPVLGPQVFIISP